MEGGHSQEKAVEEQVVFSNVFELDSSRYQDREYVEGFSRKNLQTVEAEVERRLRVLASQLGGEYIPPSAEEVEAKFDQTLKANPFVFPSVGKDGQMWALNSSTAPNMENCAAFNNSGNHGIIIFPESETSSDGEPAVRLYRGAEIQVGQQQVAPLARISGVDTQNLEDYRTGKTSLDEILEKTTDLGARKYLEYSLNSLKEQSQKRGTTEMEELRQLHTCFTPGALDWDLWVAASYKPEDTYRRGSNSVGNVYGDFFSLEEGSIEGVMILDVPESEVERYPNEAGIFAQIKPEWIKAIVPQHTQSLEANIKKAEEIIDREEQ